jgi:DNA-binding GntR family transcriptional regulator
MSLPDQIHNELKAQILSHELVPGSTLKIDALSDQFRASTIPVREALARLCSEGLAIQENRVGFKVRSVTPSLVEDDYRTLASVLQIAVSEVAASLAQKAGEPPGLSDESNALALIANSENAETLDEFLFGCLSSKRLAALAVFCLSHSRYFLKLDLELRGKEGWRHYIRRRQRTATAILAGRIALAQKLIAEERDWRIENIPTVVREMLFRQLIA